MLKWLWLSGVVVVIDQITKQIADHSLTLYSPEPVMPFFNLTLAYNEGAAFSFLSEAGGWQRWVFALLAIGVSAFIVHWMRRLESEERLTAVSLSLVLGGAIGNLIDRLLFGHVIDFVDLYYRAESCLPMFRHSPIANSCHWPAFNVADSAISVGAVMLILCSLFFQKGSVD